MSAMAPVRSDPKTRAILVESTPLSELRHLQGSILPGWLYAALIGGWRQHCPSRKNDVIGENDDPHGL